MMRDMMTSEQVAEYLQLTTDTVYRLIRNNELVASQIGRSYRIARADLEAYLRTHSNRAQVRKAHFDFLMRIAEHNPGLNSDDVLDAFSRFGSRAAST
jgi:excisionase family DNA binding protein